MLRANSETVVVVVYREAIRGKFTWVVEEIWAYGDRLRNTGSFLFLKLCRNAYLVRPTHLLVIR